MRDILIIVFLGAISFGGITRTVHAQATAKGKLTDAESGKPLTGAHVFLSGTKIGDVTNPNGLYRLRSIPSGGHRLVVSMIGYEKKKVDIIVGPAENLEMDFELKPVVYEMPEIFVGDLNEDWEKDLDRFTDLFIGVSKSADSVKILNPEVLRFKSRWWGRLSAEALAPLKIENRALGYHITYYLDEFNHTGTQTRWDGEPLFTEMTPADSLQAKYWEENREEAFYGSLRHFLLALLNDNVKEEGYIIYNLMQGIHGYSPRKQFRAKARQLIRKGDESYLYRISFMGRLKIIYLEDEEDWRYTRWLPDLQRAPRRVQTSYLELNEKSVTVDLDGEVIEPYGATQFGYFSFQRLADATPREYRPEGYPGHR